ncbi:MAG: excinuclease ABC subunit UvrA [Bacteroidota bacterium]
MPKTRKKSTPLPSQRSIFIQGARTHNLKNIDVTIPYRKMTVITGLSGSGKTSLAFDTLFADWEAKYLRTFDAYTRQLMGKGNKPPVDYIKGILPSVGLKQKSQSPEPRARIGNTADIYPYLKLLFARVGTTYSPISGQEVKRDTITDVVDYIKTQRPATKVWIFSQLHPIEGRSLEDTLKIELGKGFTRLFYQGETLFIEDLLNQENAEIPSQALYLLIDRLVIPSQGVDKPLMMRLSESVQNAFFEGKGVCKVRTGELEKSFSDRFEADGMTFLLPSPQLFDPNNPHGACKQCHGFGRCVDIDVHKVIPNPDLSLDEGAIAPWQGVSMRRWQEDFLANNKSFSSQKPYKELSEAEKKLLWKGSKGAQGLYGFFDFLASKPHKVQYRIMQARYRGFTTCNSCEGTGLRKEARHVKVGGKTLFELLGMTVEQLATFFEQLQLNPRQNKIVHTVVKEIKSRLTYIKQVGLSYLTLKRRSNTLSGGEYQRLRLSRALGSALIDTLYILDEPTVGLHPKNTEALIAVLKKLQTEGNTIVVVEHDEKMMRAADLIIDMGPEAGSRGGQVIFQGSWDELLKQPSGQSYTVDYLTGEQEIPIPKERKSSKHALHFHNIHENNIESADVTIPLGLFIALTGVSGAGKSTLAQKVIYPTLKNHFSPSNGFTKNYSTLKGDLDKVLGVELVNQNALGKSSRSNPATYTKAYDAIRKLFVAQPLARERDYMAGVFSFNIPGGRCEACLGDGMIKVEMQFIPDISVVCDSCQGNRFKQEILEVRFQDKNIKDVLDMTVDDAIKFFQEQKSIVQRLLPLQEVGLGYLRLGQSSSTFSGGEAQRVKLSAYLTPESHQHPTFFIFDEPTTGLHFHDTRKLIEAFQKLVKKGHTVIVVEHNLDLIKCADWIIDMGPDGGDKGGQVVFAGRPEEIIALQDNHTAHYLKEVFNPSKR